MSKRLTAAATWCAGALVWLALASPCLAAPREQSGASDGARAQRSEPGLGAEPRSRMTPPPSITPPVTEQVTFQQAVDRARQQNPGVQQAAQEILRARGFLEQARAGTLPDISASITNTTHNTGVEFNGQVAQPRNQSVFSLSVSALLFAPVQWALKAQAGDRARLAEIGEAEVKRQIAVAAAQAYLAIVERRRVYEANVRGRDTAKAHFDLAHALRTSGAGSLLNELRAQQALSADETLVAQSANAVYQAQEALGVLLAADHPIDTNGLPTLDTPVSIDQATAAMPTTRADLRLAAEQIVAANRVYDDTWKEWLPSVSALFEPQDIEPASFFQNARNWTFSLQASIPIFDFGRRKGERASRLALVNEAKIQQQADVRLAQSDVRAAQAAIASADQALQSAQAAADQARRVVDIVNISFRAGASTNIEVIDAQRASLDADTAVAQAEDQLRQAKLALLVALGQFQ